MSDPLGAGGRRTRRQRELGPDARCLACGVANPMVLTRVKRTMLDRHHVLGKQHDADFTVVVCRNCHALFSAAQVDDGVPLTTQPTVLERHFAIYEALVSFLRELADLLCRWIAANQAMIAGLDREFPSWRAAPWAR